MTPSKTVNLFLDTEFADREGQHLVSLALDRGRSEPAPAQS